MRRLNPLTHLVEEGKVISREREVERVRILSETLFYCFFFVQWIMGWVKGIHIMMTALGVGPMMMGEESDRGFIEYFPVMYVYFQQNKKGEDQREVCEALRSISFSF